MAGQVRPHRRLQFRDAARMPHRRRTEIGPAPGGHIVGQMAVGIDETRQQGMARQIDAAHAGARRSQGAGQGAHITNLPAPLHQRLGVGGGGAGHRQDGATGIEGRCRQGGHCRRRGDCRQGSRRGHAPPGHRRTGRDQPNRETDETGQVSRARNHRRREIWVLSTQAFCCWQPGPEPLGTWPLGPGQGD